MKSHLSDVIADGHTRLKKGERAIDVAVNIVKQLEVGGLYVAGRGASPNSAGHYEHDAAVMDGEKRRAGAVSALEGYLSPVEVARAVMDHTPHVLLSGRGAASFAAQQNFESVSEPDAYYLKIRSALDDAGTGSGTVGAVVLDQYGHLASASSTAGILGKLDGRVGDIPVIGAGVWADRFAAVACTGLGEYFVLANAAATVTALMRYGHAPLDEACDIALNDVARRGGIGGLIAIDKEGNISTPFNANAMSAAAIDVKGKLRLTL